MKNSEANITRKMKRASEIFEQMNFDPLETAIDYVQNSDAEIDQKLSASISMIPYMYPKLTASKIDVDTDVNISEELEKLRQAAKYAESD